MPALVPYHGIITIAYRMIRMLPTSGATNWEYPIGNNFLSGSWAQDILPALHQPRH